MSNRSKRYNPYFPSTFRRKNRKIHGKVQQMARWRDHAHTYECMRHPDETIREVELKVVRGRHKGRVWRVELCCAKCQKVDRSGGLERLILREQPEPTLVMNRTRPARAQPTE